MNYIGVIEIILTIIAIGAPIIGGLITDIKAQLLYDFLFQLLLIHKKMRLEKRYNCLLIKYYWE